MPVEKVVRLGGEDGIRLLRSFGHYIDSVKIHLILGLYQRRQNKSSPRGVKMVDKIKCMCFGKRRRLGQRTERKFRRDTLKQGNTQALMDKLEETPWAILLIDVLERKRQEGL